MNDSVEVIDLDNKVVPKENEEEEEEDVIIESNVSRIELENELNVVRDIPTEEKDNKEHISETIEIVQIDDGQSLDNEENRVKDDENKEEFESGSMELESFSENENTKIVTETIIEGEETEEVIEIKNAEDLPPFFEDDQVKVETENNNNMDQSKEINFDSEETISNYCMENCLEWYELLSRCGKFNHVRGKITYHCCENSVSNPHNIIFPIAEKVSKEEIKEVVDEFKSPVVWLDTCEFACPKKYGFIELPKNFNFTSIVVDLEVIQDVIDEEIQNSSLDPIDPEDNYEFVDIDTCHSKIFEDGIKLFFKVHYGEFGVAFNKKSHDLFLETYTFDDNIFGKREGCTVRALAMTCKGEVVSFLELFRDKNGIVGINNVSTAEKHRRKKLCTKLLHEAVKICKNEWNCRYICGLGSPDGLTVYRKYKVKFGVQYTTYIRFNMGSFKNHLFHLIFGCISCCGCLSLM